MTDTFYTLHTKDNLEDIKCVFEGEITKLFITKLEYCGLKVELIELPEREFELKFDLQEFQGESESRTKVINKQGQSFNSKKAMKDEVNGLNNKSLELLGQLRKQIDGELEEYSEDLRWQRCDVKSTSLLANILAKQYAVSQGAFESWLYNADGFITEGSSSNSYIVTTGDVIVTHPSNHNILSGITRQIILELAKSLNITSSRKTFFY